MTTQILCKHCDLPMTRMNEEGGSYGCTTRGCGRARIEIKGAAKIDVLEDGSITIATGVFHDEQE